MRSELKKHETVLIIIRQHWINLILPVLGWLVLTVLLFWFADPVLALVISFLTAFDPLISSWIGGITSGPVKNTRVIDEHGFISRRSKRKSIR